MKTTRNDHRALQRGFNLACRAITGKRCDVETLQRVLGVSRATAYRYQHLLAKLPVHRRA